MVAAFQIGSAAASQKRLGCVTSTRPVLLAHDPIEANLSPADDRVLLNDWLPPQAGVVPKIRIGRRWVNVLWVLPFGFLIAVIAVIGVSVAQALRELPAVQDFLVRYPGVPPSIPTVSTGFPAWLRVQHFFVLNEGRRLVSRLVAM
jgi:methionine sulfoxide reductase catalytic subunit